VLTDGKSIWHVNKKTMEAVVDFTRQNKENSDLSEIWKADEARKLPGITAPHLAALDCASDQAVSAMKKAETVVLVRE